MVTVSNVTLLATGQIILFAMQVTDSSVTVYSYIYFVFALGYLLHLLSNLKNSYNLALKKTNNILR